MDHGRKKKVVRCFNAKQVLTYLKVTAAADWQKLRKSLNQT
jgi:hypothetical protein